jgi:alkyldihydroxyacetonephosphate synthase
MRRWNGWGDDTRTYPLPLTGATFLGKRLGPGSPPRDVSFKEVWAGVPASRLSDHPLVSKDPGERVRHARGQSLPDWIALRSGRILAFPDGVGYPTTEQDVRDLIQFIEKVGGRLIPYGGGTSVVGHINCPSGDEPVLTVDLSRMSRMSHFDQTSHLATFGAGIAGPDLEAQLRALGFTLGHFPQSFELSTLGGWVATRSMGQQSLGYGGIARLFAGGRMESPLGTLEFPSFPASAAGPDLREMVLGSEGRLGILTRVTVRVKRLPPREDFHTVFFPEFQQAQTTLRKIVQAGLPLSMLRLSNAAETQTILALGGRGRLIGALEKILSLRGLGEGKCMLLMGLTGSERLVRETRKEVLHIVREGKGVHVGRVLGKLWYKNRFRLPYLRNTLWERGYAVDTLETAVDWKSLKRMVDAIESALKGALEERGQRVHVFTHLSHLYPSGSSIYTTYLYPLASDAEETLERWRILKTAASRAIISHMGTISHHHGIGEDHIPYLAGEKGRLGMMALNHILHLFDPKGIMNPGKLTDEKSTLPG